MLPEILTNLRERAIEECNKTAPGFYSFSDAVLCRALLEVSVDESSTTMYLKPDAIKVQVEQSLRALSGEELQAKIDEAVSLLAKRYLPLVINVLATNDQAPYVPGNLPVRPVAA